MRTFTDEQTKSFIAGLHRRASGAHCIIENEQGEALMLKANYKPHWSFPGGWLDAGESPRQTALRELQEETGIVRDADSTQFVATIYRTSDKIDAYLFIFRALAFKSDETITLQTSEIDEYAFVSPQQVLDNPEHYGDSAKAWAAGFPQSYMEHVY